MESALEKAIKDFRNQIGRGEKPAVLTNVLAGKKWNSNLPRFGGVDSRLQQNRTIVSPLPQGQEITQEQEQANPFAQAMSALLRTPDRTPGTNQSSRVQGANTARKIEPVRQEQDNAQQIPPQEEGFLQKIIGALTPEPTRFDFSNNELQPLQPTPEEMKVIKTIRTVKPDYKGTDGQIINLYKKHGQKLLQGLTGDVLSNSQRGDFGSMPPLPQKIEDGSARIQPYVPIIIREAQKHKIDPRLLAGALARESMHFRDQYVRGYHEDGTGRGIAGIDKKWNPQVSDEQAMDPEFSIAWMANQLANLRDAEGDNIYNALRRYNGGPAYNRQTIGFDGQSTVDELTRRHADAILQHAANYGGYFQ